jgi:hypothetical protein
VDRQVLHDLQTIRWEGLEIVNGTRDENAPEVDAAKGLSVDKAVAVGLLLWLGKVEELEGVTKNRVLLHHVEGLAQSMANGQRRNSAGGGFTLSVALRKMAMDTVVIPAASIHLHRIIAPARQVASYLILVFPKILRRSVL